MVKFIAAKCPSCRADLDIDNDTKKYTCPYCGTLVLIDKGDVKESQNVKSSKKDINDDGEERSKKDIISLAKKYINKGQYDEARDELYEIIDNDSKDTEARTLFVLACCKEVESEPIYKDTSIEVGSILLNDLLSMLEELKEKDKDKNYLKVLSEYKNNFDKYKEIYDDKMAYKKVYDKASRQLNELYFLALNKISEDKALELIKEYFDLDDKKLPHLPFNELVDKGALINRNYDEFKLEVSKYEKKVEVQSNKNTLKNIGIFIGVVLALIVLFMINPWIVYVVGMLGMFGYCSLVK